MEKVNFLSVASLEELTYKRSKKWSKYLSEISLIKEETAISLEDIDHMYGCEENEEDEDDLSYMDVEEEEDDADDLELLQDISNSVQQNKLNKTENLRSQLSKTLNNSNREGVNSIKTFLDETLPVIEKHNRIWEDSGMNRVLNTFDSQKIEEEVGSWLRQHHIVPNFTECKDLSPIAKTSMLQHSETASEDSVDTARYIRTSRKYRNHGKITPCKTMTIKTYRLVKSKRDALREKYGYLEEDDMLEFDRHSRRNRALIMSNSNHHYIQEPTKSSIYRTKCSVSENRRKKRCRKLHLMQNEITSSDESIDDEVMHCSKQLIKSRNLCCSLKKKYTPCLSYHSMCACAACNPQATTACYSSIVATAPRAYRARNAHKRREVKRESDCTCCNDDTLCEDTIHLADTSTEEWVVENLITPRHKVNIVKSGPQNKHKHKKIMLKAHSARQPLFEDASLSYMSGIEPLSSTVLSSRSMKVFTNSRSEQTEDDAKHTKKKNRTILKDNEEVNDRRILRQKPRKKDKFNCMKNIEEEDEENANDDTKKITNVLKKTIANESKTADISVPNCNNNQEIIDDKSEEDQPLIYIKLKNKKCSSRIALKSKMIKSQISYNNEENMTKDVATNVVQPEALPKSTNKAKKKKTFLKPQTSKSNKNEHIEEKQGMENVVINILNESSNSLKLKTNKQKTEFAEHNENKDVEIGDSCKVAMKATKLKALKKQQRPGAVDAGKPAKAQGKKTINKPKDPTENSFTDDNNIVTQNESKNTDIKLVSAKKDKSNAQNSRQTEQIVAMCDTTVSCDTNLAVPDPSETVKEQTITSYKNSNDCTLVTSTTENKMEVFSETSPQKILIYNPEDRETVPKHNLDNGYFTITKEHLSSILGEETANKFMKYYVGQRKFDINSAVYFCPPKSANVTVDTESDDDELECIGKYGHLRATLK